MQKIHEDLIKEELVVDKYLQLHYGELTKIKFPFLSSI